MNWPGVALILAFIFGLCEGFYLPGLAPVTYCDKPTGADHCTVSYFFLHFLNLNSNFSNWYIFVHDVIDFLQEDIKLFVNRLNSEESVIPYEYEQ